MPQMRLDKLLSHLNCGSRKEVQALIRAGRVSVDGTVQKDPAFKVDPDRSQTAVDGTVQRYRAQRYYMLNKPSEPPCRKGVRGGRGRRAGSGCSLAF